MADLKTLIRLHQHDLDEKRRALKELYDLLEQIETQKQAVLDQIAREKRAVEDGPHDLRLTYADFRQKADAQCLECDKNRDLVEKNIFKTRDDMLDIFTEMKRYDMAQQERDRIQEQEQRLRETKTLDDIALEGFRRQDI